MDAVQRSTIRRLTRLGAADFTTHDGGIVRFRKEALPWATPSNFLRFGRGGAFRILAAPDGVRIEYRIDQAYFAYGVWSGAAAVALVGLGALVTGNKDPFGALALLYCVATPFTYALSCSQAQDLFKLAVRKADRPDAWF